MDERLPACDAPRHWLARMLGRPPVSVVGLAIAYALSIIALDDSSPGPPAFYAAALISRGGGAADEMVEDGRMMGGGHE